MHRLVARGLLVVMLLLSAAGCIPWSKGSSSRGTGSGTPSSSIAITGATTPTSNSGASGGSSQADTPAPSTVPTTRLAPTPEPTKTIYPATSYKTYRDPSLGVSLEYPDTWIASSIDGAVMLVNTELKCGSCRVVPNGALILELSPTLVVPDSNSQSFTVGRNNYPGKLVYLNGNTRYIAIYYSALGRNWVVQGSFGDPPEGNLNVELFYAIVASISHSGPPVMPRSLSTVSQSTAEHDEELYYVRLRLALDRLAIWRFMLISYAANTSDGRQLSTELDWYAGISSGAHKLRSLLSDWMAIETPPGADSVNRTAMVLFREADTFGSVIEKAVDGHSPDSPLNRDDVLNLALAVTGLDAMASDLTTISDEVDRFNLTHRLTPPISSGELRIAFSDPKLDTFRTSVADIGSHSLASAAAFQTLLPQASSPASFPSWRNWVYMAITQVESVQAACETALVLGVPESAAVVHLQFLQDLVSLSSAAVDAVINAALGEDGSGSIEFSTRAFDDALSNLNAFVQPLLPHD